MLPALTCRPKLLDRLRVLCRSAHALRIRGNRLEVKAWLEVSTTVMDGTWATALDQSRSVLFG